MTDLVNNPETLDWPALFNMRDWLEKSLRASGASVVGKGCGVGGADLDILIEGFPFNVKIAPRDGARYQLIANQVR